MYKASFLGSRYRLFSNFDNLPRAVTPVHYPPQVQVYLYMCTQIHTHTCVYIIHGNPNGRYAQEIFALSLPRQPKEELSNHYLVVTLHTHTHTNTQSCRLSWLTLYVLLLKPDQRYEGIIVACNVSIHGNQRRLCFFGRLLNPTACLESI